MTVPADAQIRHRAKALAGLIPAALEKPPEAVATAITAFENCEAAKPPAAPAPGARVSRAILDAADKAAHRAAVEKITLDVGSVAQARAEEQADKDSLTILRAVKISAAVAVCATVDEHAGELIAALKKRHEEIMREFALLAKGLPDGVNDAVALEAGEPVRSKYLSARDTHGEAMQLRECLALLDDIPLRDRGGPDNLERALWNVRDAPELYDKPKLWHGSGFADYLAYARDGAEFWLPLLAEVQKRAAEMRQARRLADNARLPERPPRMPAFR
jgi:hypothetical protein